jgi:hypothetical protein
LISISKLALQEITVPLPKISIVEWLNLGSLRTLDWELRA